MKCRTMDLMKVGKDSQGDEFTQQALEKMVEDFESRGIPVTMGFDPTKPPVGTVTTLALVGDQVVAEVELDDEGEKAVAGGMELAAGGVFEPNKEKHGHNVIEKFELTGTALTDQKVK